MLHKKISASKVQRQNDCGFSCHTKYWQSPLIAYSQLLVWMPNRQHTDFRASMDQGMHACVVCVAPLGLRWTRADVYRVCMCVCGVCVCVKHQNEFNLRKNWLDPNQTQSPAKGPSEINTSCSVTFAKSCHLTLLTLIQIKAKHICIITSILTLPHFHEGSMLQLSS